MKVTLESTTTVVTLVVQNGAEVPARLWEGHTESGIPVHAYIPRIKATNVDDLSQFNRELLEQKAPSAAVAAIPTRLVL